MLGFEAEDSPQVAVFATMTVWLDRAQVDLQLQATHQIRNEILFYLFEALGSLFNCLDFGRDLVDWLFQTDAIKNFLLFD